MAEQPPSSASATDSDDFVRIPKSQYMQAITQMKQQRIQLIAASNLHQLMRDKDKEMMACKDKNEQLLLAVHQSETRLSNMIRLQAATTSNIFHESPEPRSLEADCASAKVEFLQSDVEPDCAAVAHPPHSQLPSNRTKLTDKPPDKTMLDSVAVTAIPITSVLSMTGTSVSADVSSASTSTCPTHVTSLASSVTVPTLPVSSVTTASNSQSKDLLDKVLQQNARLKKTLRDFLSHKGLSLSTYLVCCLDVKVAFI